MQWTDASGQLHTASPNSDISGISGIIPIPANDTTSGPFPHGALRWTNVGYDSDLSFDLLVTLSEAPAHYSDTVAVEYHPLMSDSAFQALYTASGFACIGVGLQPSVCASGAPLHRSNATCNDGTPVTVRATEFEFRFVRSGTTTLMPALGRISVAFIDVDGDSTDDGGNVFELVAVSGASRGTVGAQSSLEVSAFEASATPYVMATQNINVPTDIAADPAAPVDPSLSAVAVFEREGVSSFRALFGSRLSTAQQWDRPFCFAM
eukprot:6943929-Prymnesium_polylepis.1